MKPVRLAALALLCAFPAASQQRSPTSGVPQPAQSFAVTDDATALAGNPAALGFTQGLLLEYAGARGYGAGMSRGDGAYLSFAAWGLALGTSLEWLHQSSECTPLTPGLQLVGRVGVSDAGTTSAQIGVQVDFGRFGVRTAAAFPGSGGTGSQLAVVRLSSVQYPGLSIPRDRAVQVDLDDALRRP